MNPLDNSALLTVARQVVKSLNLSKGEIVEVRADIAAQEWAYGMALHLESAVEAVPILTFMSVDYEHQRICTIGAERLRTFSPVTAAIAESITATIVIKRDSRRPDHDSPKEKAAAWNHAQATLVERYDNRGVRFCMICHPEPLHMTNSVLSEEDIRENICNALTADVNQIQLNAQLLSLVLKGNDTFEIMSGAGNKLSVKITGRPIWKGDGLLREDRIVNFPTGSIYVAPLENTANGSIFIEQWEGVEGLLLTFDNGKLCEAKADRNLQQFTGLLEAHSGDKDRISHIGIGLNPALRHYTGQVAIDECKAGAMFMALGENRYLGGCNASTLNIDLVSRNCTVVAGDMVVVRNGILSDPQ